MQKTRNNCFLSKIRSTTLRQAKTDKHECRNLLYFESLLTCLRLTKGRAMFFFTLLPEGNSLSCSALVLTCFRLMKGRATYFRPETIVASFLHLMVLLFKILFNHSFVWPCRFVMNALYIRIY